MWFQNFSQINLVYKPLSLTQSTFWMFLLWRFKTKCWLSKGISVSPEVLPKFRNGLWYTLTSCGPSISVSFLTALTVVPGEGDDTSAACCTCRLPAYSMYRTALVLCVLHWPARGPPTRSYLFLALHLCFYFLSVPHGFWDMFV